MRYRRYFMPGGCYFFTLTLVNRESTLLIDKIDSLRIAFKKVKSSYPFIINAIVILPDHLHMLITLPDDDAQYSHRLGLIKSHFSRGIDNREFISTSRRTKRERGIWQRRFWEHTIRDDRDFENHVNYIHYNPVKHGHAHHVIDWPYSSFHRFVRDGILPRNWSGDGLLADIDCE